MALKNLLLVCLVAVFTACEKEETSPECAEGAQLCVQLGAERISGTAVWYRIPNQNRFRILWEEGSGTAYRNIEIDLYTADSLLLAGSFPTNDSHNAGTSAVQYYAAGKAWDGSGTLSISSISGNAISGSFSGTLTKVGTTETMEYSSGQLKAVPRQ